MAKVEQDDGRRPRQEGTYHRVLDAAVELLRETKYSELTVRAIAARAEVSPATAYNYFKSKNGLIAEVYLRLVRTVPLFVDVNQIPPSAIERVEVLAEAGQPSALPVLADCARRFEGVDFLVFAIDLAANRIRGGAPDAKPA